MSSWTPTSRLTRSSIVIFPTPIVEANLHDRLCITFVTLAELTQWSVRRKRGPIYRQRLDAWLANVLVSLQMGLAPFGLVVEDFDEGVQAAEVGSVLAECLE